MAIAHIRDTAAYEGLEQWGKVGIPIGEPVCTLQGIKRTIPGREVHDTGVWQCSPGQFRREIKEGEVMHILSGECTFTPDDGETIEIQAGDTLFLPPMTTGVWHIRTTVRKIYVLL